MGTAPMTKSNVTRIGPLMTARQFNDALAEMGLTQTTFGNVIERLAGQRVAHTTVNRWANGKIEMPPLAVSVVRLLQMLPRSKRTKLAQG